MKEATLRMYNDGDAAQTKEYGARLAPEIEFAKVVEAAGGYGETVIEPDAVPGAIARALDAVRGGRPAVLHVKVPPL